MEIPFAQYSELSNEYDPDAAVWIYPAVTSLELELAEEGRLRLKAGLTGQYILCDKRMLSLTQDAYSLQRELKIKEEDLELPVVLEDRQWQQPARCPWSGDGKVVDVAFCPDHPRLNGSKDEFQLNGRFLVLYHDEEGVLRSSNCKWEQTVDVQPDENSMMNMYANPVGSVGIDGVQMSLQTVTMSDSGMKTVGAIELGELEQKDPARPSLILRRAGKDSLWQIAKKTGSTVFQIQKANALEGEPAPDTMLMIPVL